MTPITTAFRRMSLYSFCRWLGTRTFNDVTPDSHINVLSKWYEFSMLVPLDHWSISNTITRPLYYLKRPKNEHRLVSSGGVRSRRAVVSVVTRRGSGVAVAVADTSQWLVWRHNAAPSRPTSLRVYCATHGHALLVPVWLLWPTAAGGLQSIPH